MERLWCCVETADLTVGSEATPHRVERSEWNAEFRPAIVTNAVGTFRINRIANVIKDTVYFPVNSRILAFLFVCWESKRKAQ